jgi:hypothetical protein
VLAIDTAADICEGIVTEEESNIESDAISVEKTSGAIAGFNPNTNKFDSDSLDDLEVT